ncbi:tRNA lysidine(34) synthetase TilS [Gilvimarinus xylanilyticus]|uniref:tRNA(Ile)-lysidine synthase n=1 Tax=Gilvimarinus xylanilyticus TaxID=2944139 RepID=A0A9X2HV51_9GAMM|nr:tRNA lysidine(34) synthetase TilS [Gilvimarinus xylanilyticus]MCP8898998.1 tRNA lysidine(34) synthetase TilS [Gilvimarinus xylanilyticus]
MNLSVSEHLSQALAHHPARRWLVAYSGGLDSSVLLHALVICQPKATIEAVHVNHGLSPHADAWQEHCQRECQTLGVKLHTVKVEVDGDANIEERARRVRYQAMADLMQPGDYLLLAQHRQDQAETLLYRLMRGAGVKGLAAMAPERGLGGGQLLRPLLDVDRSRLLAYAQSHHLSWITDESNLDEHFDRNYLRHQVLPVLQTRWPAASQTLARSAEHCREAQQLLEDLARLDGELLDERGEALGYSICLTELARLPERRRNNWLRYWLQQRFGVVPGHQALADIHQQLLSPGGATPQARVDIAQVQLRRHGSRLYALASALQWTPQPNQSALEWLDKTRPLSLPGGDRLQLTPAATGQVGLSLDCLKQPLQVRWRQGGERCRPQGRAHSQTLKKLLQEYQAPAWLRSRVPLLYVGGELAAVGNMWVNHPFAACGADALALNWLQQAVEEPRARLQNRNF